MAELGFVGAGGRGMRPEVSGGAASAAGKAGGEAEEGEGGVRGCWRWRRCGGEEDWLRDRRPISKVKLALLALISSIV
jgi:hypothetical protein